MLSSLSRSAGSEAPARDESSTCWCRGAHSSLAAQLVQKGSWEAEEQFMQSGMRGRVAAPLVNTSIFVKAPRWFRSEPRSSRRAPLVCWAPHPGSVPGTPRLPGELRPSLSRRTARAGRRSGFAVGFPGRIMSFSGCCPPLRFHCGSTTACHIFPLGHLR